MKSPNEILVEFMKWKSNMLKYPNYFTKEDEGSIMKWSRKKAQSVLEKMFYKKFMYRTDYDICAFCVYFVEYCNMCSYGKRHGICNGRLKNNIYGRILRKLKINNIGDYIGSENINNKISELVKLYANMR